MSFPSIAINFVSTRPVNVHIVHAALLNQSLQKHEKYFRFKCFYEGLNALCLSGSVGIQLGSVWAAADTRPSIVIMVYFILMLKISLSRSHTHTHAHLTSRACLCLSDSFASIQL